MQPRFCALTIAALASLFTAGCPNKGGDKRDLPDPGPRVQQSQPESEVQFNTSDHWRIYGDLYTPSDTPIGGVVLLHQRGGKAGDWLALCQALEQNGIAALAIDQRGAGRSVSGGQPSGRNAPWDTFNDIDAAVGYLRNRFSDKRPGHSFNVGLVGASYGANNALIYAAAHTDPDKPDAIKCVSLFSPGAMYETLDGLSAARKWKGPLDIFYASHDGIAGVGPQQIFAASTQVDVLRNAYDDDKHGTDLLNQTTIDANVVFLRRTLK